LEELLTQLELAQEPTEHELASEFFFASLREDLTLDGMVFDRLSRMTISKKGKQTTFDLVLQNVTAIAVVQVVDKFEPNSLDQVEAQINSYPYFFPEHKAYKLHGGIAAFDVPDEVAQQAQARGLLVLKPQMNASAAKQKAREIFDAKVQAKHQDFFAGLDLQYKEDKAKEALAEKFESIESERALFLFKH
jgi:erythromycin esterase-like protein